MVEMPKAHARYDADSQPTLREQPKKIDITQPTGPVEVEGTIRWEGWQVRASVNPDEGPVLHQLSLDGGQYCTSRAFRYGSSIWNS